ncbi:Rossmann-fold NAD(P)-binding domain-containing protein [Capnocytophaga canimorsus]|uniref:epimerase n=1 Tax=Capnocytophaga canimorsus TaxID=28188 RepID=UPI000D6E5BBF|nr:epimerase [Capnocytophaga canimorsus]AWL77504.1 epimerase [Capnocytophaga canimorsus]AYW36057.1 epimerase [Capnocytophaga canimorsus]MDT9498498.1 epimerase [Capnocytophaga canimorsus]
MNKIGIIGCGWLGLHLAKHFASENKVFTTTTSVEKQITLQTMGFEATQIFFPEEHTLEKTKIWECLQELETIIITIPFSKNTDIKRLENKFQNMLRFISNYNKSIFLMSSIGIYPQVEQPISEHTFQDEQLHQNMLYIENQFKKQFPQINILRLGGLMGGTRMLSKYKVSNLDQAVNHVHYEDVCLIVKKMILKHFVGKTYNIVAPLHPTKKQIIDYQNKIIDNYSPITNQGRIILGTLCSQELDYQYKHTNPIEFQ